MDKIGAKLLSKGAMIVSSLWIAVLTIMKGYGKINLSIEEIIISGAAITAVWGEVSVDVIKDMAENFIDWDYILIDEAQDFSDIEKKILFKEM